MSDQTEIIKQLQAILGSNSDLVANELIVIENAIKLLECYDKLIGEWNKALGYPWYKDDQAEAAHEIELLERYDKLIGEWNKEGDEIQQVLGKALGYPWYKDDQKNFPCATENDGVCVGAHVAVTIAAEAAHEIERLKAGKFTEKEIHEICHNLHGTVDASAFAAGCEAEQRKLYGCAPHVDALAYWKRYASYLKVCAQSGEHKVMDFEAFQTVEKEAGR